MQAESKVVADIRAYAVKAITLINGRAKKLIRDVQEICTFKRDALSYKRLEFLQVGNLLYKNFFNYTKLFFIYIFSFNNHDSNGSI